MLSRKLLGFLLLIPLGLVASVWAAERRPAIVVLETPPLAEHLMATRSPEESALGRPPRARLFEREADDYREGLRRGKAGLAARLAARGIVLEGQTETVLNALMVQAGEEDLAWLRAQPGVKSAEFAVEYRMWLNTALPLVGVPQVWTTLGGEDNAGRGVKIGIIDSGIDQTHPMFADNGFTAPLGFPKVDRPVNSGYANNKVIVARNFSSDSTAYDGGGHGTFVAAVAAGRRAQGPLASIAGVAPGAFLGNYKVFASSGSASGSSVITAIDAAVSDGMDVINFSGGSSTSQLPENDANLTAILHATNLGVVVVIAAGNCGPNGSTDCPRFGDRTIASPAIIPEVISVGSTTNSRSFSLALRVTAPAPVPSTLQVVPSIPGSDPVFTTSVGPASLVDVTTFDSTSLGCGSYPAGSLAGKIALIKRGICFFTVKIANAAAAGALAVVVYNNVTGGLNMDTTGSTIPSAGISNTDGVALVAFVRANPATVQAVVDGQPVAQSETADLVGDFSSRGPSTDFGIKPDMVVPGDLYSATQNTNPQGLVYSPDRFVYDEGTSFSAPLVAGASALMKQTHSSLTVAQIKSALVNTATPLSKTLDGAIISVMNSGAGKLNMPAAVATTLVADPVSLSFGAPQLPQATFSASLPVRMTNVGTQSETFAVTVAPRYGDPSLKVTVNQSTLTLAPGSGVTLNVSVSNTATLQSSYEGFINVRSQSGSTSINVPYWVSFATPVVNAGGVVNGASFQGTVSPGAIVSVFGLALGGTPAGATTLPLPTNLGGAAVRIGNADVPLFFSSTGQLNLQLPFTLSTGTATGTARLHEVAGPSFSFQVSSVSPGIFTSLQNGAGPGAILHAAGGTAVAAGSPAQAGEFVSIFCTGLGGVTQAPAAGTAATDNPLATTLAQPTVTIGGVPATVQFSGLAPGFVSLYQVNVQVPTGVAPGDRPLVLTIGGATANTVTIRVQ